MIFPTVPVYCRCTPGRAGALLPEPSVVSDQNTVGITKVIDHITAQLIADRIDDTYTPRVEHIIR